MNPDTQTTGVSPDSGKTAAGSPREPASVWLRRLLPFPPDIVGAAFYAVLGSGLLRLTQALGVLVLARGFTPASFGRVSLIQSTLTMLVAIGGLGVGPTATRLVAQRCESDPVELRSAVSLTIAISIAGGFTVALLVGIYAEPLCLLAFNDTSLAPLLRIGSFSIVLASMWNGLTGTLQGFLDFRSVACSQTAYGLVLLLGFLAGVRYFGEQGVIWAFAARARGDRASFDRVLRGLHNGVAVPLNIAALLLAAIVPLLSGLLGKPYRGVSEATALLLVSVAIQGYGAPGSVALQCSNRLWWGFALNLAWAAAVLFMAFKFVGTLDSSAVALGYSAGYVLLVISQSFLLREFLPAPLFKRSILGALLNLIPTGALAFASTGSAWQWPVLLLSSVASLLLWCPSERQRGQEGSGHMPRFSETESLDPETR